MTTANKHLYRLDELSDYKVSDGYNDVKGWNVKDRDNRVIGTVDNLLVNKESERVVYLDVEVDQSIIDAKYDPYSNPNNNDVREFVNNEGENHVIIPIGLVDIDQDQKYVYTDSIDYRTFAETKRYRKGDHFDRTYELAVLDSYNRHNSITEERVREIVQDEVESNNMRNTDKAYIRSENEIREIVRDEVKLQSVATDHTNRAVDEFETGPNENSAEYDDRTRRDSKLDFDHDNDGNPNVTDPDYYDGSNKRNKYTDDNFYKRREFDDSRRRNS
jgi:hypothetical protein